MDGSKGIEKKTGSGNDDARKRDESESLHPKEQADEPADRDWEEEFSKQAHLQKVENWQHFLSLKTGRETGVRVQWRQGLGHHQHMVKALATTGKLKYVRYYITSDLSVAHGVFFFAEDMVSFPGVLHGGSQFTAFDETCGQLAFLVLTGGAVTVSSQVSFKKPFPAGKCRALVTARVEKLEKKKAIITATLRDSPNGPIYTHVKMVYVKVPETFRAVNAKPLHSAL